MSAINESVSVDMSSIAQMLAAYDDQTSKADATENEVVADSCCETCCDTCICCTWCSEGGCFW